MITLFVDASYHERSGAAGWGAWAKSAAWDNQGRSGFIYGGCFGIVVTSSNEAELLAIVNAIQNLKMRGRVGGQRILVNSDCTHALRLLATHVKHAVVSDHIHGEPITPFYRPDKVDMTANEEAGIKLMQQTPGLMLRHCYGHMPLFDANGGKSPDNARIFAQYTADRIAREHMRIRQNELMWPSRRLRTL